MKSANTFGVYFIVRTSKAKGNEVPIYVRICVNLQRVEISLKRKINLSDWNRAKGMAKPKCPEFRELNNFLEQVRATITRHYSDLLLKPEPITAELIKYRFLGIEERKKPTLCEAIVYHNTNSVQLLSPGTLKNYTTTEKYIKRFLSSRHRSDIDLIHVDYRFITEFEVFLRQYQPTDHQKKLENNGVMKHMERFQKICNMAVKMDWMEKSPFAMFQLKFHKVERGYLTQEEVDDIANKVLDIQRMELIRDLFIFACHTGQAYIDLMNLTKQNIVVGVDGLEWIISVRQKTNITANVPLLNTAKRIIERYANDPRALHRGKLFPGISNQKLNCYLKELGAICEIKKELTFHLARHTFATTILLCKGVTIESAGKMLGHTKITTTQIYAKVVERKISEEMCQLRKIM